MAALPNSRIVWEIFVEGIIIKTKQVIAECIDHSLIQNPYQ
jgi:hypothetical protein